jgi:hypothetical protein
MHCCCQSVRRQCVFLEISFSCKRIEISGYCAIPVEGLRSLNRTIFSIITDSCGTGYSEMEHGSLYILSSGLRISVADFKPDIVPRIQCTVLELQYHVQTTRSFQLAVHTSVCHERERIPVHPKTKNISVNFSPQANYTD